MSSLSQSICLMLSPPPGCENIFGSRTAVWRGTTGGERWQEWSGMNSLCLWWPISALSHGRRELLATWKLERWLHRLYLWLWHSLVLSWLGRVATVSLFAAGMGSILVARSNQSGPCSLSLGMGLFSHGQIPSAGWCLNLTSLYTCRVVSPTHH